MRKYTFDIVEGLIYLHAQGVVHRDIKAANCLTTKSGVLKLADFGIAARQKPGAEEDMIMGSPYWMAPEVIELKGFTTASDIWYISLNVFLRICVGG